MMTMADVARIEALPKVQAAVLLARLARKAAQKGVCGEAAFFVGRLNSAKYRGVFKATTSLKALRTTVDRCFVKARAGGSRV